MRGAAGHDLRDVDAVVARNVLVAETACYAEAETRPAFDQLYLHRLFFARRLRYVKCVFCRSASYFL